MFFDIVFSLVLLNQTRVFSYKSELAVLSNNVFMWTFFDVMIDRMCLCIMFVMFVSGLMI